jgi:hypothetical protein
MRIEQDIVAGSEGGLKTKFETKISLFLFLHSLFYSFVFEV